MTDAYYYSGTEVLKNLPGIRDADLLRAFETEWTMHRLIEGAPVIAMTPDGYRRLHKHIFQDVYEWAGETRTVPHQREGLEFPQPQAILSQMEKQFELIRESSDIMTSSARSFAQEAAGHIADLNRLHPFRAGNGRTLRVFLKSLGSAHGHEIDLIMIDARQWLKASTENFKDPNNTGRFEMIVRDCLVPAHAKLPT